MRRVPRTCLFFDPTDVLKGWDRIIMKILVKAVEQNYDSNRRFYVMHFRILICKIRNQKPLRDRYI